MYDAFAEGYEQHASSSPYNALYDRPAVLSLLGQVAGKRVLDAACGPGLLAEELLARGAEVVGFDGSAEMVRLAGRRLGPEVEVRVHDLGEPLGWLAEGSCDLAVLALAIHYVEDRVRLLSELRRVLVPGGALVVSTAHPMADWVRLGGSYFEVELVHESLRRDTDWPVSYWRQPLSAMVDEFAAAGFLVERLHEPRPLPEMAERFPADHAQLLERPAFVAFRLLAR